MATSKIKNLLKTITVSCSGTTNSNGLLGLNDVPSLFYPIYAENYPNVTTFFNGSGNTHQPYVRITDYSGAPIANTEINNLKVVCVAGGGT